MNIMWEELLILRFDLHSAHGMRKASSKLLLAMNDGCRSLQDFVRVDLPVFFDNDV